jgi:predicted nucleic-acid-binding Zn-ribbon protein
VPDPIADQGFRHPSAEAAACPKCGTALERGFVTGAFGISPDVFIERKPEYDQDGLVDDEQRRRWIVRAYRCQECGFLEFYAKTELERDRQ